MFMNDDSREGPTVPPLSSQLDPDSVKPMRDFYCPQCSREVEDPLVCGDCSAVICRTCGTPLESAKDLGIG
jgi:hypothetical protein